MGKKKVSIYTSIDDDLNEQLQAYADGRRWSKSAAIAYMIEAVLKMDSGEPIRGAIVRPGGGGEKGGRGTGG